MAKETVAFLLIAALLLTALVVILIAFKQLPLPKLWALLPKRLSRSHLSTAKTPNLTTLSEKGALSLALTPYVLPPLRARTSSRMAMNLKRLDVSNWLTLDTTLYLPENRLRCNLLLTSRLNVLQVLPGTEDACHEVLQLVVSFLSHRFPEHFTLNTCSQTIYNHFTNESHFIGPQCPNPLEIAATLAMEDFNILIKDERTGEYNLMASATLFPAGWQLQERIGTSMANLHRPVPGWKEKLGSPVNRYFDHLSPRTAMERTNLFIQTTPLLFQDAPESPSPSLAPLKPEDMTVRRERQTFTRLEKSGAVLFTVRTYMQPLLELEVEDVEGLLAQVRGWEDSMRSYKGWGIWGPVVEGWCEGVLAKNLNKSEKQQDGGDLRQRKLSV